MAAVEAEKGRSYGGLSAGERAAARRARLLDAALELYGTRGFLAVGVKDVCREAGLTDRYFYESFRDSRELFTGVFDGVTAELFSVVTEEVAAVAPEPRAQVRAAIGSFVRTLADDPRKARVVFMETASAGAEAEAHMRATLRRFASLVAATARPHLPPETPDRLLAMGSLSLVGAIERVVTEWQAGELDVSVEEMTDYLVSLFIAAGAAALATPRAPSGPSASP